MFRFIAIAWDPNVEAISATAAQLGLAWQAQPHWDAALNRPGLKVFTHGTSARGNTACSLQDGAVLLLGKVFRRSHCWSPIGTNVPLTSFEAEEMARSNGRSLINAFWGRYVAFLQTASASTLLIRDPSGSLPCFRVQYRGVSIVFSWLEDALLMLGDDCPRAVNWDAITAQLIGVAMGGRETSLHGVAQILPGEALDLHTDNSTMLWSAVQIARSAALHDPDDPSELLRETVQACATAWASCYDALLLRLSGGVDSSILLSCLATDKTSADVICINYHSPGSDSDERVYARLAAVRSSRDLLERERDPGFRIECVFRAARMPNPVVYVGRMNASADAALASAYSAPALFTGAGGDAVFYELLRWWPAADYLQDHGLNAGFPAVAMDAARLGKVSVWRTIALALAERIHHDPAERQAGRSLTLLAPSLQHQAVDLTRFANPATRDADELPIGKYMQTMALMHPLGYYDPLKQASAPEVVHPLLSQPLVELCLRLPTYVLTQGGHGRALARRAFAADLPPQITSRRTKGGMEDHLKTVLNANMDFVRSALLDGQLAQRGMLDRQKLEEVLAGNPTSLASPMSQLHGLVAIEAWLSRWTNR